MPFVFHQDVISAFQRDEAGIEARLLETFRESSSATEKIYSSENAGICHATYLFQPF